MGRRGSLCEKEDVVTRAPSCGQVLLLTIGRCGGHLAEAISLVSTGLVWAAVRRISTTKGLSNGVFAGQISCLRQRLRGQGRAAISSPTKSVG